MSFGTLLQKIRNILLFEDDAIVFQFTGGIQFIIVPAGVTTMFVRLRGAGGGAGWLGDVPTASRIAGDGGAGGMIEGRVSVAPGQSIMILVGGGGDGGSNAGSAISGWPANYTQVNIFGGAGGGYSRVRNDTLAQNLFYAGAGAGGGTALINVGSFVSAGGPGGAANGGSSANSGLGAALSPVGGGQVIGGGAGGHEDGTVEIRDGDSQANTGQQFFGGAVTALIFGGAGGGGGSGWWGGGGGGSSRDGGAGALGKSQGGAGGSNFAIGTATLVVSTQGGGGPGGVATLDPTPGYPPTLPSSGRPGSVSIVWNG